MPDQDNQTGAVAAAKPKKKKTWLIVSLVVVGILLLLGCCCAGAVALFGADFWNSMNVEPAEEWTDVSGTEFKYISDKNGRFLFTIPDKDWKVKIDLKGWKLVDDDSMPSRFLYAHNPAGDMFITAFAEPAASQGDAEEARDMYIEGVLAEGPEETDVKFSKRGEYALVEYTLENVEDSGLNQRHVNCYIVRDGIWFDFHISKLDYKPIDRQQFMRIIDSITFTQDENPAD